MRPNIGTANRPANIVVFPVKAQSAERLRARGLAAAEASALEQPVVYDGAWYHDEAIQEDRSAKERSARTDH